MLFPNENKSEEEERRTLKLRAEANNNVMRIVIYVLAVLHALLLCYWMFMTQKRVVMLISEGGFQMSVMDIVYTILALVVLLWKIGTDIMWFIWCIYNDEFIYAQSRTYSLVAVIVGATLTVIELVILLVMYFKDSDDDFYPVIKWMVMLIIIYQSVDGVIFILTGLLYYCFLTPKPALPYYPIQYIPQNMQAIDINEMQPMMLHYP